MPLIVLASFKASPGVTTTALGLGVVAASHMPVWVCECDPAGGDLQRRHGLAPHPNLVDLAAATRGGAASGSVGGQVLWGQENLQVVVAPAGQAPVRAALPALLASGTHLLRPADRLVIADAGRWDPGSPARALAGIADVVVMCLRGRAEEVAHLRQGLDELLGQAGSRLLVLLGAGGSYPAEQVQQVLTRHVEEVLAGDASVLPVWGPLPQDGRSAGILTGALRPGRAWQHLPLMRALRRLWVQVRADLPEVAAPAESGAPVGPR